MTKAQELEAAARGEGCLGRSQDDEPVFVLCARDPVAASVVREWAQHYYRVKSVRGALTLEQQKKYAEAIALADRMDEWAAARVG